MANAVIQKTSKQHPVPQNIMSVEFKLVGDLTIRQFGYVAAGAILAYLSYSSGLPFLWKWFLVLSFAALGLGMAFVPLQDRGLDIWIKSFIKAILEPARLVWGRELQTPFFVTTFNEYLASSDRTEKKALVSKSKEQLAEYLEALQTASQDPLEEKRTAFLRNLDFSDHAASAALQRGPGEAPPELDIRPKAPPFPKEIGYHRPMPAGERSFERRFAPKESVSPLPLSAKPIPQRPEVSERARESKSLESAIPNVIHGIVYDNRQRLLEGAVVVIKDQDGDPVRALKTNALGRFAITTPLENGKYLLEVKKDGGKFDTIEVALSGKPIKPLEIMES